MDCRKERVKQNNESQKEELKTDRDNFESTETVKELEETNIQIQRIRPHVPIDGDNNERNDDIEINELEVEQNLENNIGIKAIEDLPNQPDPSADQSTYDDNKKIETVQLVSDNEESTSKPIRAETNEFINEISTKEKYGIKILEIEYENPERDKKTIKKQDKIPTTEKSLKFVGENPERDKKIIEEQDRIRDKITKEFPLEKNSVNQKFEWPNPKEIKKF